MALLLITHDLGVVRVAASRALVMYAGQIVDEAPTAELIEAPVHPYSRGLVGAWPRLGDARRELRAIPGIVPPATAWPGGCRFRERCASAWGLCESEAPVLTQLDAAHATRCHLVTLPRS
jgi:oligopeptide/dipeptide ABC transporter ATP-binding protein